jgi:mannitol-1-/sugar-/sorbitol-6-phosphatase
VSGARLLADSSAVLSDLDGTLIDSSVPVHRIWGQFARRHGLDAAQVVDYIYGRPTREAIPVLVPDADHAAEIAAIDEAEVRDVDGVSALPGALALLSGDRAVAIVTSCTEALARARLHAAGLPAPPVLVSADDVQRGKPDPECFLLAAARLGVDARSCLVLEDAPAGIAAGRAAGASVIALRTTRPDQALQEADVIVDSVADILDR